LPPNVYCHPDCKAGIPAALDDRKNGHFFRFVFPIESALV